MVESPEKSSVAGEALAQAIFLQSEWQMRKVERHVLDDGDHNVIRVSIDCQPPGFNELYYDPLSFDPADSARSRLLVPITFMAKGNLRNFDMRGPDAVAIPIMGRSEYAGLMREVLLFEYGPAVLDAGRSLLCEALDAVLDGDPDDAVLVAKELVKSGTFTPAGKGSAPSRVLDADLLTDYASDLTVYLAKSYVLIALVDADLANRRTILKYSHETQQSLTFTNDRTEPLSLRRVWVAVVRRMRLAAGLDTLDVEFALGHPRGSASHHVEVAIPDGLLCDSLTMPPPAVKDRNSSDEHPVGVAHGAARYERQPDGGAVVKLRVQSSGLRRQTALVCFVTAFILLLGLTLPGAQRALLDASDGAAAVLLVVPAIVVALVAARRENAVVSMMLRPLRVVVLLAALLLLACAASIVGVLADPWRYALWILGLGSMCLLGMTLSWREFRELVSGWGQDRPTNDT